MARVDVPITAISRAGATPAAQVNGDTGNGHELAANDGKVFIEAVNADAGGGHGVTIHPSKQVSGLTLSDVSVTVPASGTRLIGPLPPRVFNQPMTGKVNIDVAHAQIKLRAYKLP